MNRVIVLCVLGILWGISAGAIRVENFKDGETVSYQLIVVRGSIGDSERTVVIRNLLDPQGKFQNWPAHAGKYKAAVMLRPGRNIISLSASKEAEKILTVYWNPLTAEEAPKFARMVYALPSDHATKDYGLFQAPPFENNRSESALKRLRLAALMMQTATAELMDRRGEGKKTFRLERESDGRVKVYLHVSERNFSQMTSSNSGSPLLGYLKGNELRDYDNWEDANHFITASVTRYVGGPVFPRTNCYNNCNNILAGEAWGGNGGGWVHSANLFSWAEELSEVPTRFMDTRNPMDYNLYPGRTFREGFWATYALTLGSFLHEGGHGWGLPHTPGDCGIMNSYYENINRLFMATEPSWNGSYEEEEICWEEASIRELSGSPHLGLPKSIHHTAIQPFAQNGAGVGALRQNLPIYNAMGQKVQRMPRFGLPAVTQLK